MPVLQQLNNSVLCILRDTRRIGQCKQTSLQQGEGYTGSEKQEECSKRGEKRSEAPPAVCPQAVTKLVHNDPDFELCFTCVPHSHSLGKPLPRLAWRQLCIGHIGPYILYIYFQAWVTAQFIPHRECFLCR